MRICFVASRFPFPITKGDSLRAYYQIRELSREHSVHLIAGSESVPGPAAIAEMRQFCQSIDVVTIGKARSLGTVAACGFGSRLPLQVLYFRSPRLRSAVVRANQRTRFDVIHAMTIRVAPAVMEIPDVPVVVDFMDSFAANISTRRQLVSPVARLIYDLELSRVARYEREVASRVAGGVVIAELDRDAIGNSDLDIVPNGVDAANLPYHDGARDPATLIFTGNMGYQPNVDAITWFVAECWPVLRARRPDIRLIIVGARPAPLVASLAHNNGIEVTGRVDSMVPYLHRATVSICPIRCGSGLQNKVLEAMAAGAPVVTTAFANRSIGAVHGRNVQIADTAQGFADAVSLLLTDAPLATGQALEARRFVQAEYTWAKRCAQLVNAYAKAIERHATGILRQTG